jgi:hypothetical protein
MGDIKSWAWAHFLIRATILLSVDRGRKGRHEVLIDTE